MGFSKYFQSNSMRSSVTNYKDYARLSAVSPPNRPISTVFRTWADNNGFLNFHDGYTNIVGKFLTGVQASFDNLMAAFKLGAGDNSVIVGSGGSQFPNSATGQFNIVGGCANSALGSYNLVAGSSCTVSTDSNLLTGQNNTINSAVFGSGNAVSGYFNTVTGGYNLIAGYNQVIEGSHNMIAGKNIQLSGSTSSYNAISGLNQVVSGAANNIISGRDHDVSGINNTIAGSTHHVDGDHNGVEGYSHYIYGDFNHTEGQFHSLADRKDNCHAEGKEAACYNYSQHAEAAGKFANSAAGSAQYTTVVAKGITTSLTPVELLVDGHNVFLAKNKGYSFTTRVFGLGADLDVGYVKEIRGVISIGATSASTTLLAPVVETVILDMGDGFLVTVTANTSYGTLKISVTGAETEPIRWIAYVEMLEISFV